MLSLIDIEFLEKKALSERKLYELGDFSPIGEKIFNIIENIYSAFVLLYPLQTKSVAGFIRKQNDIVQIFINTGFNTSYQIFTAAHELYHMIQFKQADNDDFIVCNNIDISETFADNVTSTDEYKANYFAAAFLLPRDIIKLRFSNIRNRNFVEEEIIMEILKVQAEYAVPYKTIVKRLIELKIISISEFQKLLEHEDNISEYYRMLDIDIATQICNLEKTSNRKYHTLNVPKIAFDAYRKNIITISKLESVISQYDKSLADFKVIKKDLEPINIDFSNYGIGDDEIDED